MIYFSIWERKLQFNTETKCLHYNKQVFTPDVRKYSDIKDLYDTPADIPENTWVYYMYRDIYFSDVEKNIFVEHGLRYDITIMIPQLFWDEYNKTYGHFHPKNIHGRYFEEVYNILHGSVKFLLQDSQTTYYTNAYAGESVLMKAWYWHVSINPSETEYLVMADIVDASFSSIYDLYKEKLWASHLYKKTGWETNENYETKNSISNHTQKLSFSQNIYDEFLVSPKKFDFLK